MKNARTLVKKLKGDPSAYRIILKCMLGVCGVDWIHEAQDGVSPVEGFCAI
jgi:hypothetical protein